MGGRSGWPRDTIHPIALYHQKLQPATVVHLQLINGLNDKKDHFEYEAQVSS